MIPRSRAIGLGRRFLGRLAQRSWALQNRQLNYAAAYRADRKALGAALQPCAIINLSDSEISKTITSKDTKRAGRTSDWAKRLQSLKPRPHIVLCGGQDVFQVAREVLAGDHTSEEVAGVRMFRWSGIPFIQMCHPTARYSRQKFAAEHERAIRAALKLVS